METNEIVDEKNRKRKILGCSCLCLQATKRCRGSCQGSFAYQEKVKGMFHAPILCLQSLPLSALNFTIRKTVDWHQIVASGPNFN